MKRYKSNECRVLVLTLTGLASCGSGERAADPLSGGLLSQGGTGVSGGQEAAEAGETEDPAADSGDQGTGGGPKLDVGDGSVTAGGDEGGDVAGNCDCADASPVAYIWIANSSESTVSKINTVTMKEEGRYRTHPGQGNPSRTSVTITGRAVAVANRNGGVVKVFANEEDCTDANGDGVIQTSGGATDVLAWGTDECVSWFTDLNYASNRPVAWTCLDGAHRGEKVWTSGTNSGGVPGGPSPIDVLLLDGATGAIDETIVVEGFNGGDFGGYGGAVDAAGNFFVAPNGITGGFSGGSKMARIDAQTLDYELIPIPASITSYGITVDTDGNPWVTSYGSEGAARYNVDSGTWDAVEGFKSQAGIMRGEDGRVWVGTGTQNGQDGPIGVLAIDPATMTTSRLIPLAGGEIKGISVDPQGKIWAVNASPGEAFRIDPAAMAVEQSYAGLNGPYTYSDMTGYGVQSVTGCVPPPAG